MTRFIPILLCTSFFSPVELFAHKISCEDYSNRLTEQKRQYHRYCNSEEKSDDLFPEYLELIKVRKKQGKELTEADFKDPEKSWCEVTKKKKVEALEKKRLQEIAICKQAFDALYDRTDKTVNDLIPKGFQRIERKGLKPLKHDFNKDGVKDEIFAITKPDTPHQARLMVVLSQKDGQFKSLAVAAYHLGNNGKESGRAHSSFTLVKPDRFVLTTVLLDINNWDSRKEWVLKYKDNSFILLSSSKGATSISYDDASEGYEESKVVRFDGAKSFISETMRCDTYHVKKPHYSCQEIVDEFEAPDVISTLENFSDF